MIHLDRVLKYHIEIELKINSTVPTIEMAQRVQLITLSLSFENLKSPSRFVPVHDPQPKMVSNKSNRYKVRAALPLICGKSRTIQTATPVKTIEIVNVPPTVAPGPISNEASTSTVAV